MEHHKLDSIDMRILSELQDNGRITNVELSRRAKITAPPCLRRMRALEKAATPAELEDAEDTAAVLEWKARDAAGQTTFVSAGEARRRLGMSR